MLRIRAGQHTTRPDTVAAEEPLEIRLDGKPLAVTMRTPGDDFDLVHGFLATEGVITGPADVAATIYQFLHISPDHILHDLQNRPHVVLPDGDVIAAVV